MGVKKPVNLQAKRRLRKDEAVVNVIVGGRGWNVAAGVYARLRRYEHMFGFPAFVRLVTMSAL